MTTKDRLLAAINRSRKRNAIILRYISLYILSVPTSQHLCDIVRRMKQHYASLKSASLRVMFFLVGAASLAAEFIVGAYAAVALVLVVISALLFLSCMYTLAFIASCVVRPIYRFLPVRYRSASSRLRLVSDNSKVS